MPPPLAPVVFRYGDLSHCVVQTASNLFSLNFFLLGPLDSASQGLVGVTPRIPLQTRLNCGRSLHSLRPAGSLCTKPYPRQQPCSQESCQLYTLGKNLGFGLSTKGSQRDRTSTEAPASCQISALQISELISEGELGHRRLSLPSDCPGLRKDRGGV